MMATEKVDIEATVNILKQLDGPSLLLIDSGARLLAARQDMDKDTQQECTAEVQGT